MSAITQTKNINDVIQAFLDTHGVDTEVFDEWKGEETQKAVAAGMKRLGKASDVEEWERGYILYCNEFRDDVKKDNPDKSGTDIASIMSQMWKDTWQDEKEAWKAKASDDSDKPVLRHVATQTFEEFENLDHILKSQVQQLCDKPLPKPLDNDDKEPPSMFYIKEYGIIECIYNTTDGNYAQSCLDYYAKCTCCKRHQKNKPTVWHPWIELSPPTQPNQHDCLCACRAMSRHICRLFPDWDDSVYE